MKLKEELMKKITIGVVDDNKDFCDVVTEHLKKLAQRKYTANGVLRKNVK